MNELEKMKNELMNGDKAKKVENLAGSEEAKRISRMIDKRELKKAVETGNKDKLGSLIGKVLETEDGKKLMRDIGESFGKNP